MLKPLDRNASRSHFSSAGTFSFVGAKGILDGRSGVGVRLTHGTATPSLQQAVSTDVEATEAGGCGKQSGITCRSISARSERYKPQQFLEMCTIWRDTFPPISMRSKTDPTISSGDEVMPMMLWLVGTRYASGQPICSMKSTPAVHVWQQVSVKASTG